MRHELDSRMVNAALKTKNAFPRRKSVGTYKQLPESYLGKIAASQNY